MDSADDQLSCTSWVSKDSFAARRTTPPLTGLAVGVGAVGDGTCVGVAVICSSTASGVATAGVGVVGVTTVTGVLTAGVGVVFGATVEGVLTVGVGVVCGAAGSDVATAAKDVGVDPGSAGASGVEEQPASASGTHSAVSAARCFRGTPTRKAFNRRISSILANF